MVELAVSSVGFLLTVMLSTILSGQLIETGKGYGKLFTSPRFQRKQTLFWAFLIEAVALSRVRRAVHRQIPLDVQDMATNHLHRSFCPLLHMVLRQVRVQHTWKSCGLPSDSSILNVAIVKLLEWLGSLP